MRFLYFVSLYLLFSSSVLAQQLPIFSQYREYSGLINPAAVPLDYFINANLDRLIRISGGQRLQWIANENFKVSTSVLSGEIFKNQGNSSFAAGAYFMHDEVDATQIDGFFGKFALYVGEPRNRFWGGIGFNVGYTIHSINLQRLKALESNDPLLQFAVISSNNTNIGIGGFGVYQWDGYDKMLLFGISIPQLYESEISFYEDINHDYVLTRHYYSQVTFITNTSKDDFGFLEFSAWGKYIYGLPPNIDLNVRYQLSSPIWLGLGGSTNGTVHIETGTFFNIGKIKDDDRSQNYLKIGYAMDFPLDPRYSVYYGTSHEINLSLFLF